MTTVRPAHLTNDALVTRRRVYTISALVLYPIWGMVSSALLFSAGLFHDWLLLSLAGSLRLLASF